MLDRSTERILRRMDRMGFAGAGEALREIELLGSQLAMAHAETLEWIDKYNECEKPDERDAEIERLRALLVDGIELAECTSPYVHETAIRRREWAVRVHEALGE